MIYIQNLWIFHTWHDLALQKREKMDQKKEMMDLSSLFEKHRSGAKFSLNEDNNCEYEVVLETNTS